MVSTRGLPRGFMTLLAVVLESHRCSWTPRELLKWPSLPHNRSPKLKITVQSGPPDRPDHSTNLHVLSHAKDGSAP